MLIKEWLRAATPLKDGKLESGGDPAEWQETIMPLLQVGFELGALPFCISFSFGSQVIDRLPLGINQLRKSKIGSNILKLAKNPPNGGKLFTIQTHTSRTECDKKTNVCKVGIHLRYVVLERHEACARLCQNLDPSLLSHQLSSSLNLKFINTMYLTTCFFGFLFLVGCALCTR